MPRRRRPQPRDRSAARLFPATLRRDPTFALWVVVSLLTAGPAASEPATRYVPLASVRLAIWLGGNYLIWRLAPLQVLAGIRRLRRGRLRGVSPVRAAARHAARGRSPSAAGRPALSVLPIDGTSPPPRPERATTAPPEEQPRPRGMFEPVPPWVGPTAALTEACLRLVRADLRAPLGPAVTEAVIVGMSHAVVEGGTTDLPAATPAWGLRAPVVVEPGELLHDVPTILALARAGGYRWIRRPELDPLEVFGPAPHEVTSCGAGPDGHPQRAAITPRAPAGRG